MNLNIVGEPRRRGEYDNSEPCESLSYIYQQLNIHDIGHSQVIVFRGNRCYLGESSDEGPVSIKVFRGGTTSQHPFAKTARSDVTKGEIDGLPIALKTFRAALTSKEMIDSFILEAFLWSSLKHPSIIPILGLHVGMSGNMSMVSKYMENGTLGDYLKSHQDVNKLRLLKDVAAGITYLHNLNFSVLHADIRCANVLINDLGEALIADFGLSLVMDPKTLRFSPHKHAYAGSVRWTAPEKLKPCEYSLSLKCDVYSFACLCVEVFSGTYPFSHLANDGAVIIEVLVRRVHPARPLGPGASQLTDAFWELLLLSWERDPARRPSMEHIHRFLNDIVLS